MKFRIKDEDGKDYTVEEILEKKSEENIPEVKDDEIETNTLTAEEITALKSLAAVADKLVALLAVEEEEHEENPELVDEDIDEDETEEIIDTDEEEEENKMSQHDSKKSFGSLEKRTEMTNDSAQESINAAWEKRYGGKR